MKRQKLLTGSYPEWLAAGRRNLERIYKPMRWKEQDSEITRAPQRSINDLNKLKNISPAMWITEKKRNKPATRKKKDWRYG